MWANGTYTCRWIPFLLDKRSTCHTLTWLLYLFLLLFIRSPGCHTDISYFRFYTWSSFGFPTICLTVVKPPILALRFCVFCSFFYCTGHKQRKDTYFYPGRLLFFPMASFSHPNMCSVLTAYRPRSVRTYLNVPYKGFLQKLTSYPAGYKNSPFSDTTVHFSVHRGPYLKPVQSSPHIIHTLSLEHPLGLFSYLRQCLSQ
jgi:hypothetical protein